MTCTVYIYAIRIIWSSHEIAYLQNRAVHRTWRYAVIKKNMQQKKGHGQGQTLQQQSLPSPPDIRFYINMAVLNLSMTAP